MRHFHIHFSELLDRNSLAVMHTIQKAERAKRYAQRKKRMNFDSKNARYQKRKLN